MLKSVLVPLAMVLVFAVALAGMSRPPHSSKLVAILFPPWWSAPRTFGAAAGVGSIAAVSAVPFVLVVAPNKPDYVEVLRRAGAWLVFDPRFVLACGTPQNGEDRT